MNADTRIAALRALLEDAKNERDSRYVRVRKSDVSLLLDAVRDGLRFDGGAMERLCEAAGHPYIVRREPGE